MAKPQRVTAVAWAGRPTCIDKQIVNRLLNVSNKLVVRTLDFELPDIACGILDEQTMAVTESCGDITHQLRDQVRT